MDPRPGSPAPGTNPTRSEPERPSPPPDDTAHPSGSMSCTVCGAIPDADDSAARLTWSRGWENGRVVWNCPSCTRRHARAIESKLDSQWW